ncbi:MAG: ABC transporter ATP-binding protein [Acidimicrobiia bacterium]
MFSLDVEQPEEVEAPLIDVTGVTFTYPGPPRVNALRGVTLKVQQGEFVAIMGPSGSGKSTLLNVLGLLDRPSSGIYRLAGKDVSTLDDRARTRLRATAIGFVFQDAYVLNRLTCHANVVLPLAVQGTGRSERSNRVAMALRDVGLDEMEARLAGRLSGGQRQRLAIARALVGNPAVLLADEPSGNIDSGATRAVLDVFGALHRRGTTIVLITHDAAVAERAGRIVMIDDGQVIEEIL